MICVQLFGLMTSMDTLQQAVHARVCVSYESSKETQPRNCAKGKTRRLFPAELRCPKCISLFRQPGLTFDSFGYNFPDQFDVRCHLAAKQPVCFTDTHTVSHLTRICDEHCVPSPNRPFRHRWKKSWTLDYTPTSECWHAMYA